MHPSDMNSGATGARYPSGQFSVVTAAKRTEERNPTEAENKEIHKLALERFRYVCEAEADWRKKAQEELEFVDDGKHWSDAALKERAGRPCLTFDLITGSIDQVINNMRQSPPEPRVAGVGIGRDRMDAAIIQGTLRNIDNDSGATVAWTHAYQHAVKIGRGWTKVDFEYEDDDSFLQRIKIRRVFNPFSIYPDPFATEFDFSDMRYCFETDTLDKADFEEEHPGKQWRPAGFDMESNGDPILQEWYPNERIRVANYWWVEKTRYTLYQLTDGTVTRNKPEEYGAWVNSREVTKRRVRCAKMTGAEILKIWDWPRGGYIPLVPVIGKEKVIKGKRKLGGMIRPAMDANLAYDYARSKEAEAISLSSISQWIAGVQAIQGFEQQYASSNTKAIAVLKYNETNEDGKPLERPVRISPEPASNALSLAIAHADEDRKTMLQTWDANLGAPGPEQSGRAINLRQRQGDNAHFDYADNLGRAIRLATIIELELFPVIYSEERELMIADPDGSQRIIKINQDFEDKNTGQKKNYTFSDDTIRYHVTIGTGPSFASRRAEQTERIMQIGQAIPAALGPVLDLLSQLLDLPDSFAERWRPASVAAKQQNEDGDGPTLQQMQQMAAQQADLIQKLTAQLQAVNEDLKTKRLELESKERIAAQNNEAQLTMAALKAQTDGALATLTQQFAEIEARLQQLPATPASEPTQAPEPGAAQPQPQPAGAVTPAEGQPNA